MKYSAYPAYKDSGVEWLGEIPEDWEVKRLKLVCTFLDSHRIPLSSEERAIMVKEYPYYGASGIIDYVESYLFDEPLILVAEDGANLFSRSTPLAFVASGKYWVNNHAHILRPNDNSLAYWAYVLATIVYDPWITGSAQPKLTKDNLGSIRLPAPQQDERDAIASFLDRETAKIDALIAKKERLIELLQEKRTAIINHAVTKGLDPTVPLENSGVDWLGEVPAHWKVLSVRRLAGVIEQGWSPVAEDRLASEDEWGVIKLSAVSQGLFRPEEHKTLPENMEADQRYEIKAGDFLVTRANTPNLVGDVCVVSNTRPHLMLSDLVYRVFVDDNRVSRKSLCYWFLCRAGRYQITRDARGSSLSMVKVSQNSIRSWLVALPPFLEQQAIASYLDRETAKIDALIAKIREGIEKLKEYRTALISAAVTGKIDVRNEVAS